MHHVDRHRRELGLTVADLAEAAVLDSYLGRHGITHVYLQQRLGGIEVEGALIDVSLARDGSLLHLDSSFVAGLADRVHGDRPAVSRRAAILRAAERLGLSVVEDDLVLVRAEQGPDRWATFAGGRPSRHEIPVHLVYQPMAGGSVRLAWQVHFDLAGTDQGLSVRVDAGSGETISISDWMNQGFYPVHTGNITIPGPRERDILRPGVSKHSRFGKGDLSVQAFAEIHKGDPIDMEARISCDNLRPGSNGECTFVNVKVTHILTSFPPNVDPTNPSFTVLETQGCLDPQVVVTPTGAQTVTCTLDSTVNQQDPAEVTISVCMNDVEAVSIASCPVIVSSRPPDFSGLDNTSCVFLVINAHDHLCTEFTGGASGPRTPSPSRE